jgi:hypothetical protein
MKGRLHRAQFPVPNTLSYDGIEQIDYQLLRDLALRLGAEFPLTNPYVSSIQNTGGEAESDWG